MDRRAAERRSSANISYDYDGRDQLEDVTHTDTGLGSESYTYDDAGNRTAYGIGSYNRMAYDGSYHYFYDNEGNLTSRVPTGMTSGRVIGYTETMSKRRKRFPSETSVKRGVRKVHGEKLLEEKLGRNDLCPCGSGRRFKRCYLMAGRF